MRTAGALLLLALSCAAEPAESGPERSSAKLTAEAPLESRPSSPPVASPPDARQGARAEAGAEAEVAGEPKDELGALGVSSSPVLPEESAGEWRRFFLDGCWETLAEARPAALASCARIHRDGSEEQKERCACDEELMIEVRSSDPIFAWTSRSCWNAFFGRTKEKALAHCERQSNDYTREQCPCGLDNLAAVRGPYTRSPRAQLVGSDFVYLAANGQWLDDTGDWPCFAAGTLIETADGPRPIEEVELGDLVRAFDVDAGELTWSRVRRVKRRHSPAVVVLTMADGSALTTTPNHPFYVPDARAWRAAQHLREHDALFASDGSELELVTVRSRAQEATVYNLSTETPHNYFAGGVLVHNY